MSLASPPGKQFMLNFVEIEPCMWIKVYMTAGINPMCAGTDPVTPTCVQHTFALPFHAFCRLFTLGAHCVTPAVRHVPPQVLTGRINAAEMGNGRPGPMGRCISDHPSKLVGKGVYVQVAEAKTP